MFVGEARDGVGGVRADAGEISQLVRRAGQVSPGWGTLTHRTTSKRNQGDGEWRDSIACGTRRPDTN
jgi:hypothetical protein